MQRSFYTNYDKFNYLKLFKIQKKNTKEIEKSLTLALSCDIIQRLLDSETQQAEYPLSPYGNWACKRSSSHRYTDISMCT